MNAIRRSISGLLALSLLSGAAASVSISVPTNAFAQDAKVKKTSASDAVESLAPVKLFETRDPNTKELIQFSYQPTSRAELAKISPSKYRAEMRGFGPKHTLGGSAKKLLMDFPAEYLAFTIAMGISQRIHLDNNPVFVKNFVEENVSAVGALSFGGFLVGARSSHAFLQMLGLAHDPWRAAQNISLVTPYVTGGSANVLLPDAKGRLWNQTLEAAPRPNYFETKAVITPSGPTRVQKIFSPLVGPMGLATGMMVSNVIHEVLADENLKACAKASVMGMPKVPNAEALAQIEKTIDEACDKAWEDWRIDRKLADYTPDILSMAAASIIQAYAVNPLAKALWRGGGKVATKASGVAGVQLGTDMATGAVRATAVRAGSERIVPIILKGAQIAKGAVGAHPVGRFVMTAANITVFMEIIHFFPPIKQPWERSRQGRDITNRINELYSELDRTAKNQWVWLPRPASDFCDEEFMAMDPMGNPARYPMCYEVKQSDPAQLLKKMAERQAKWREFVLQDAYLAHKNWQTYVADYSTMYGNATAFYTLLIGQINYQRFHPKAATSPSYLYDKEPLFGGYPDIGYRNGEAGVQEVIRDAREWLETYNEGVRLKMRNGKYKMPATEQTALPEILLGMRAMDKTIPLKSIAPEVTYRNLDTMTENQRADFEHRIRGRLFENAMAKLRDVLKDDLVYNDRGVPPDSDEYERRAEKNPFMALRLRLGPAEPLPAGQAFVRQVGNFPTVIEQESKKNHPGGIGRVRTTRMTDFLLASMVCGPEADPRYSDKEKIQIFNKRQPGALESLYAMLGLGRRTLSANDAEVLNAVNEEIAESTTPVRGWTPNPSTGATSHEWAGISADFRPPRIVEGVPASICKNWADNSDREKSTMYEGDSAIWTIGDEKYEGMLDIVRKKIRADLVGNSLIANDATTTPFSQWWDNHVNKHTEIMVAKFRANFRSVLKDKFIPALNGTIPIGFWNSVFQKVGILKEGSIKYNGREFQLGALESLYAEAGLYLSLLEKVAPVRNNSKVMTNLSAAVLLDYKNIGSLVTDLELVEAKGEIAKAQFDIKRNALKTKLDELEKLVDEVQKTNGASEDAVKVKVQALKNLNGLMGELDSYWGVVRTIQISPTM